MVSTRPRVSELALYPSKLLNAYLGRLLTALLVLPGGLPHGDRDSTVSAVLGWNQMYLTNTRLGLRMVRLLDILEVRHCEKAYEAKWTQQPSSSKSLR